jgi:hypothetical protein
VLEKDGEDGWILLVKTEEAFHGVKEERNILRTINIRKAKWIGHFLGTKCLLRHVIEVNIEGWMEEKEDVSSYLMFSKREDTVNLKRKH